MEPADGYQLKREGAIDTLALTLTGLEIEELAGQAVIDFPAEEMQRTRFQTFDGLVANLESIERDGVDWIRLSFDPSPDASEGTIAEARTLTEKMSGRVFAVPSWKLASIKQSPEEIIEPLSAS
ncbi:MAG: hypothetical protein HC834_00995 [Rhodospirillales bacterium]|nr:hypothetical protein [Rhodospirillales bacterium]